VLYPVLFIAIAGCLLIAMTSVPAATQQNATGQDIEEMPLSLVIDSAMTAHEQDIKDRMFDYEFDHAGSEAAKVTIVKKRSNDLAAAALKKRAFLEALENQSSLIPDGRLKAMVNATISTIERMTGSSKKLQEKSKKLDKHAYTDSVTQAVAGLDNATMLADRVSKAHTSSKHT
jgi:hypothetical protein